MVDDLSRIMNVLKLDKEQSLAVKRAQEAQEKEVFEQKKDVKRGGKVKASMINKRRRRGRGSEDQSDSDYKRGDGMEDEDHFEEREEEDSENNQSYSQSSSAVQRRRSTRQRILRRRRPTGRRGEDVYDSEDSYVGIRSEEDESEADGKGNEDLQNVQDGQSDDEEQDASGENQMSKKIIIRKKCEDEESRNTYKGTRVLQRNKSARNKFERNDRNDGEFREEGRQSQQKEKKKMGVRNRLQIDDDEETGRQTVSQGEIFDPRIDEESFKKEEMSAPLSYDLKMEQEEREEDSLKLEEKDDDYPRDIQMKNSLSQQIPQLTNSVSMTTLISGTNPIKVENKLLKFKEREYNLLNRVADLEKRQKVLTEQQQKLIALDMAYSAVLIEQKNAAINLDIINTHISLS